MSSTCRPLVLQWYYIPQIKVDDVFFITGAFTAEEIHAQFGDLVRIVVARDKSWIFVGGEGSFLVQVLIPSKCVTQPYLHVEIYRTEEGNRRKWHMPRCRVIAPGKESTGKYRTCKGFHAVGYSLRPDRHIVRKAHTVSYCDGILTPLPLHLKDENSLALWLMCKSMKYPKHVMHHESE